MDAVMALVLGVVVFMHAWQFFGLIEAKTAGIVGAAGAIAIVAVGSSNALPMMSDVAPAALSASAFTWAVYAVLVAAVGLWGVDARGLGLYSAYAGVLSIGQIVYCVAVEFTLAGIVCGLVQGVVFALLFLYLAIPLNSLKSATSWVLVVAGPIHGLLAALMLLGVPGIV